MTSKDLTTAIYKNYPIQPYIAPDRDLNQWLLNPKPVPKRNMELLKEGLLAGDIILLWRIQFDTFTTESVFPKYFEYTYGIEAKKHLKNLVDQGYAYQKTAFNSLEHLNAALKKRILKQKGITGLSKMKVFDLDQALKEHFVEKELGEQFSVRGYGLTEKGERALKNHQEVIDRHPQKKF